MRERPRIRTDCSPTDRRLCCGQIEDKAIGNTGIRTDRKGEGNPNPQGVAEGQRGYRLMIVAGEFSFKGGKEYIERRYPHLLEEICGIIGRVSAADHMTKVSKEKTMPGRMLYNPRALNAAFKKEFSRAHWKTLRINCEYPSQFYAEGYQPKT